jgi:hypothetical protein
MGKGVSTSGVSSAKMDVDGVVRIDSSSRMSSVESQRAGPRAGTLLNISEYARSGLSKRELCATAAVCRVIRRNSANSEVSAKLCRSKSEDGVSERAGDGSRECGCEAV